MSAKSQLEPIKGYPLEYIQYGFKWGPLEVIRIASVEGRGICLGLRTPSQEYEVYVTPAGKRVRFFDKKHPKSVELK